MISKAIIALALLGLYPAAATSFNEQCAVCMEEGCKTGVSRIILANFDKILWQKENEIPECSVSNLKPDTPCMMSNGSLVLRTEQPLHFEGKDGASGGGKAFRSTNMLCADLDLPPSLKSSSGTQHLNQINATANSTTTPASAWPLWKKAVAACGSVFAVIVIIGVIAIIVYRRRCENHREGQEGECPSDNTVQINLLDRDAKHN